MSTARLTWKLKEITAYTAECEHCGADLLEGCEYACWVQSEGVEESISELIWCPKCNAPITELGYEAQEDE